ncbi:MAG: hypothetical protein M3Y86_12680, partial [Verrucomicrobiota bacterium]|nr:hypothetical protein [Verrucomicrobiota bacterium]
MNLKPLVVLLASLLVAPTLFAGSRDLEVVQNARWPEVWGDLGVRGYGTGDRVAPNGLPFEPLFKLDFNLNVGLLPQKKLYLFLDNDFWAQRAAPGITNKNFGNFDFSKREDDIAAGLAWNIFDRLELRGSVFSMNNLNRGTSKTVADDYQNGVLLEARYYFG